MYKDKNKQEEYMKSYYRENRPYLLSLDQKYKLRDKYNITVEEYNERLMAQEFKCAICLTHVSDLSKRLFVDHDHTTGKVRGLLCYKCNTALGLLGDSIESVKRAVTYLEE